MASIATTATATAATRANLTTKYQKMTDMEHILKKPDTYIGSIQLTECTEYTAVTSDATTDASAVSIELKTFSHIPALYKLDKGKFEKTTETKSDR